MEALFPQRHGVSLWPQLDCCCYSVLITTILAASPVQTHWQRPLTVFLPTNTSGRCTVIKSDQVKVRACKSSGILDKRKCHAWVGTAACKNQPSISSGTVSARLLQLHTHIYIFIERELSSSIQLLSLASITLPEVLRNSLSSLLTHMLSSEDIPSLIMS